MLLHISEDMNLQKSYADNFMLRQENIKQKENIKMSKYVIVDLEMCRVPKGLKREEFRGANEIVEIGAVLLDNTYEITDKFKTYVSPEYGEVDRYIQELTGITKTDTVDAPTIKEALELFAEWLPEDAILVSWSDNDEKQIRKEIELKNLEIPKIQNYLINWKDCQKTFSEKMNTSKKYRLSEALIIADIDYNENIHDGLVDAENTAMLFAKMKREPKLKLISCYLAEEDNSTMYTPISGLLKNFSYAI